MTLLINRRIRPNMDDYILFRRQKSSGHYLIGIINEKLAELLFCEPKLLILNEFSPL